MTRPRYPHYDVLAKWNTPSWDDASRATVAHRLRTVPPRRFFGEDAWRTLWALCETAVPQDGRAEPVPIAPWIDEACVEHRTNGTRYDGLPDMREIWPRALAALDAEAQARCGAPFAELDASARADVVGAVGRGETRSPRWEGLDTVRVVRDVFLKEIVGVYYAHPTAWNEIGFGGPASPRGYVRLGPDAADPWEAREEREGGQ